MPIRYSNLSYQTNVIIASKKIEKTTDKDDKTIFICINATFSKLEEGYKFGRTNVKVILNDMESDANLTLCTLKTSDLNALNEENIESNLKEVISNFMVERQDGSFEVEIDITKLLEDIEDPFSEDNTISIAIRCYSEKNVDINLNDINTEEVIIGEIYNNKKEKYLHKAISQDLEFVGSGKIDLYSQEAAFDVLNITTSGKNPVSLKATYNEIESGSFGYHYVADYDYQIRKTNDYVELIDNIGDSYFYLSMTKEKAKEKYEVEVVSDDDLYVNISDDSYILNNDKSFILVKKDKTKFEFISGDITGNIVSKLYLLKIILEKYTITYTRNENNQVSEISSNDTDKIKIKYDTRGNVLQIDYDNKRFVKFSYEYYLDNRLISQIEYCDKNNPIESTTIQKISRYEYSIISGSVKLFLAYDDKKKIGCKYEYEDLKATKVTYILKDTEEYTGYYEISKNDNIVTVTNNLNESTYYYLDERGRCYLKVDEEGNTVSTIYEDSSIGANANVVSETNPQINDNNILLNGDFEGKLINKSFHWMFQPLMIKKIKNDSIGYNGKNSLMMNNDTEGQVSVYQTINNAYKYKNKKLFLKGYVRGEGKVNVNVKIDDIDNIVNFDVKNIWEEVAINDIYVSDNVSTIKVIITLESNTKVRLSSFSLCVNEENRRYNYIQNGKFVDNIDNWKTNNFDGKDLITPISNNEILNKIFTTGLKITGNLYKIKEIRQEIALTGGAGEELLFSFFKKANLTLNDICYAYMKISYTILGSKTYGFKIDSNVKEYEKVIQSIVTESCYNAITVGLKYLGKSDLIITDFGLFKEELGNYYSFNESKSLLEIANGSSELEIEYNKNEKVKRITNETGEIFEYTYDDLGNIILITDSSGNSFNFEYDENGYLKKSKITTIDGKTLEKELVNDSRGNVLQQTDYDGNITMYEYDDKNRVKMLNKPSGEVEHYEYDNNDNIINKKYDIETNIISHEFSYNEANDIKKIKVNNDLEYKFEPYDEWWNLEQVKLNNKELNKINYYKKSNFYTGEVASKEYSNGNYYNFNYDEHLKLKSVEYIEKGKKAKNIVNYEYDRYGKVIKKSEDEEVTNYIYDGNDAIIKEETTIGTTKKCKITEYDNLGNTQQKAIDIDNEILNYNYVYDYEFNEYQSGGYFSRLENSFNEDIIFENSELKYGDKSLFDTVEIEKDHDLRRKILKFTKDTSTLTFLTKSINSKKAEKSIGSNLFNKEEWAKSFEKRKELIMWVRVNSFTTALKEESILTLGNETKEIASIKVNNEGELKLSYNEIHIDSMDIRPKEWNLVGLTVEEIDENNVKISYFVNKYLYETTVPITETNKINRISLGTYCNNNVTEENLTNGNALEMPFDILYVGIGEYQHTKESYKGIYNEGYKYLFTRQVNKQSGVIYYNHNVYEGMDVIPLNGSLTSIKGLKPLEYTYGDSSFRIDKTKLFKLDKKCSNIDEAYTSRHTYASYGEEIGISGKNKSMLSYDLGIEEEGTISLRFKCDYIGGWECSQSRTIIASTSIENYQEGLVAYVDNATGQVRLTFGGQERNTGLYIIPDRWHQLLITWNQKKLEVSLDDKTITYANISDKYPNLKNFKTYIGCNYLNDKPCLQLFGSIEMLSYSNTYQTGKSSQIQSEGKPISILTEYDGVKRPIGKEINTGYKKLNYEYIYNDENQKIDQTPKMEILPNGEKIVYSYDISGNITHKVKIENETIKENINYQYDASGRLIKEKCYDGTNFKYNYGYKYNQSGDILEKIEYNISDVIISKEVYNYSTTNSSQLLSINKINTNNEIIETKTITYLEEDPFRPATYKNNNLTWNGKRLTSYGTNTYKYNSEGIRISKTTSEGEYKYLLDGNKIIKEIKPTNKEIYYHYDEKEELVGFNYNAKEYFYIRDITGNITNIIDSNGTIKVSYEYDAWGKVINIDGDEDLIEINSYLYKGYYYDKETQLFYCNSRYYSPELCRWISPDSIEYLDPQSINGLNLYCYCMNNPINKYDPSGHFAISAALFIGTIVVGALIGGGTAAYSSIKKGDEWYEVALKTLSGAALGGMLGAAMGTGAALAAGGTIAGLSVSASVAVGMGVTVGGSAVLGATNSFVNQIIDNDWDISKVSASRIGTDALVAGIKGLLSFGAGAWTGGAGLWNVPKGAAPGFLNAATKIYLNTVIGTGLKLSVDAIYAMLLGEECGWINGLKGVIDWVF